MKSRCRWYVAAVSFTFMLLHQADKLFTGPLTSSIVADFHTNEAQMGAVSSLAIAVASLFLPVWGYLYDRYPRPKLLALASVISGTTPWFNALAPTCPVFLATRSTTEIDDSSYPGVFSLLSDTSLHPRGGRSSARCGSRGRWASWPARYLRRRLEATRMAMAALRSIDGGMTVDLDEIVNSRIMMARAHTTVTCTITAGYRTGTALSRKPSSARESSWTSARRLATQCDPTCPSRTRQTHTLSTTMKRDSHGSVGAGPRCNV